MTCRLVATDQWLFGSPVRFRLHTRDMLMLRPTGACTSIGSASLSYIGIVFNATRTPFFPIAEDFSSKTVKWYKASVVR